MDDLKRIRQLNFLLKKVEELEGRIRELEARTLPLQPPTGLARYGWVQTSPASIPSTFLPSQYLTHYEEGTNEPNT